MPSGTAGFRLALVEILFGVGGEFGSAAGRAEMKGFAACVEPVLAGRGIDGHAADGIAHARRAAAVMLIVSMTGVMADRRLGRNASPSLAGIRVFGLDHRILRPRSLATYTL